MKTCGKVFPTELMIIHKIIIVPRSPEAACPACFVPSYATMLGDCTTLDTPVSSKLCTLISSKFLRFKCTLIIVDKFHSFCCIECSGPEDLYFRTCEAQGSCVFSYSPAISQFLQSC